MVKLPAHMQLRAATLTGIKIEVPTRSATGGRNLAVHEFVGAEEPYIEDLGAKARKFSLDVVLIGPDYASRRDQLQTAFAKPGPLDYVDPWGLSVRVHVGAWELREEDKARGKAVLRLDLQREGANAQPAVVTDTGFAVREKSGAAGASVLQWFSDRFDISADPARLSESPVDAISRLVQNLKGTTLEAQASPQPVSNALADLSSLQAGAFGLLRTPLSLGSQVQGVLGQVLGLLPPGRERYRAARGLATGYGNDFEPIPPATATKRREIANRDILIVMVRSQARIEQAKASADMPFLVREDAEAARDELSLALESLAALAPDFAFVALIGLRAAVVEDITSRAIDLKRLSRFTPLAHMPALLVAHKLYGDHGRETEIVARNAPLMPGYLSAGRPLTVMADAGGER